MNKKVGIWIDHREAVIVFVTRGGQETTEIESNVRKHLRQSGETAPADDRIQNITTEQLNKYYDEVIAIIHEAELAFIFGPGEAKGELEKRLAHAHYKGRVVGVEPADRLTEPQIVAKVRDHYFDQLEAKYASGS
ncbi:MAG: hypothetical protein ABL959_03770 [Pyrinomonadaceae bacterium]